jgi:hypothetical protein
MRSLRGKSARLSGVDFDKNAVNTLEDAPVSEVPTTEEVATEA